MRTCLTHKQKIYTMNKDDSDVDINKDINVDMGFTIGQVSLIVILNCHGNYFRNLHLMS